jgi:tRNA-splicing ligase RtcB
MVSRQDLTLVEPYVYEIAQSYREDMRVPARLYADDVLLELASGDRSLEQLVNTATLPGIVGHALAMPDVHQGYGFPIGGVAATALPHGVISPGGVGYDINCGVRLLTAPLQVDELRGRVGAIMDALFGAIPVGVGEAGGLRLSRADLTQVLEQGSDWPIRRGYGRTEDAERTEDGGCMRAADASALSPRALERGLNQLGTLGSGNHFLELDEVSEVFDPAMAQALGLYRGQVCVWIHCGSRGLGHQVCTDAVKTMQSSVAKYGIVLPDRELACAPFDSPEGQRYFTAMACAANYAWANRQVITHQVRQAFERVLGRGAGDALRVVYDVCHNVAKVETHQVEGKLHELCVHRKGATRAFGPGRAELPAAYRSIGQPVLVPGNMAVGSYVLLGTERAMQTTFGSACHGAGRAMSRAGARRGVRGQDLRAQLEAQNIAVRAGSMAGLAEEAPDAYKDVDRVVEVMHLTGVARKVARTRPLGVIKG